MTRCLIMAITMMAAALVVAAAPGVRTYVNARFAFSVDYPSSLAMGPSPANGDGREFHLRSGAPGSISASAGYNVEEAPSARLAEWAAEECSAAPSYRVVRPDLVAVSCVAGSDVVYQKTLIRPETVVTLRARYPAASAATWEPIVRRMAASLRPGA